MKQRWRDRFGIAAALHRAAMLTTSGWSGTARARCVRKSGRRALRVESLEARQLLSVNLHGFGRPDYVLHKPDYVLRKMGKGARHFSTAGPTGYTPAEIRSVYGFDQTALSGSGTTIAIVDAYDDPKIANDLHKFDQAFGLPDPVLTKVNQNGGAKLPSGNTSWATEIALDVEWAHAIAPGAKILLVEANNSSFNNLFTAINYARHATDVVAVSMSWGGGEFSSESAYDGYFTTPAGHTGVTFLASSGDSGAPVSYPAVSPDVVSVGGTSLYLSPNTNGTASYSGESGWSGSGGGISAVESQPAYQAGVVTQTTSFRTNPDVAYDADPNTGFPVYDSYGNPLSAPWLQIGGTSDAAPQWAGLIALADQGRMAAGKGALDGATQTLPMLYSMSSSDFHDVTSGVSTGQPSYWAGPGYDLVTGRGTPYANLVIDDLVGTAAPSPTAAASLSVAAPSGSTAGATFSVTVSALNSSGNVATGYQGTVYFSSSDMAAGLPQSYTFTSGSGAGFDNGVHTFSVTLTTAGNQTISVADTATGSIAGSATVSVTPAAAAQIVFDQQPTSAATGATITPAVTVKLLDAYGNLLTTDNTDQVTLAIGANPGSGTLSGTTTVTVSGGVAVFNDLSISAAGTGYTLVASSGTLGSVTSAPFDVTDAASSTLVEGFETSSTYYVVGGWYPTAYISTVAAHDGNYGLVDYNGNDWIYRNDAAAQVQEGDTISVWVNLGSAPSGRAYFGFGADYGGTLSIVAAPNTNQLLLQDNSGWGFVNIGAAGQRWQPNHWYRLEVDWGTSGMIVGKLFDSDGATQLNTVTAYDPFVTSGGIAFRATGSTKYWDTVQVQPDVNQFAAAAATALAENSASSATAPAAGAFFAAFQGFTPYLPPFDATPAPWGNGVGAYARRAMDSQLVDSFFGLAGF